MADQKNNAQITKNVMVLMPFRTGDRIGEKQSYLDFLRIKYLIEKKIKVNPINDFQNCIEYKVNYFKKEAGIITEQAFTEFRKNDLFVALITKTNVNVIYEIAVLNVLQEEMIILVDINESKESLPVYIENYANIPFFHDDANHDDNEIERKIKKLSEDPNVRVYWDNGNIGNIPELKESIDLHDERLRGSLERAIQEFENGKIEPPEILRDIAREIHPSKALSSWTTYIPYSVIKINWRKLNETGKYSDSDRLSEPEVVWCNSEFCRLLEKNPDPSILLKEHNLTGKLQMELLKPNIEEKEFSMLLLDQLRIFQEIFLDNKYSQAWVPIEFNANHANFPNKAFLPTLIAKKEVGILFAPHSTYYIIAFIEDFFPLKDLSQNKIDILKKFQ